MDEGKIPKAFVAYACADKDCARTIEEAIKLANAANGSAQHLEPWIFNEIAGRQLTAPIIENIRDSNFMVADVTYLNLNVVYEIGFAIANNKRVFCINNNSIDGDQRLASSVGIFDTLGYQSYSDAERLRNILTSITDVEHFPISTQLNPNTPIYTVSTPQSDTISATIISRIKKMRYRFNSYDPNETTRLAAKDAIDAVGKASGVILRLLSETENQSKEHNIRTMFVAGLAHGMEKPTLILCDSQSDAPLDVRDSVKTFSGATIPENHFLDFWPRVNELSQKRVNDIETPPGILQNLSIGEPAAENEMQTLSSYYMPKDEFHRASRGEVNLVVGRKGAGKTALWVYIRDHFRKERKNVVVDLKPESFQLIKLKEEVLSLMEKGSQQHLIVAFWEYLILIEVAYKLIEKDARIHLNDHTLRQAYEDLNQQYIANNQANAGDFSERLLKLSESIVMSVAKIKKEGNVKITTGSLTEILYKKEISLLKKSIQKYLENKEKTLVLFDNLDRGWATSGVDNTDTQIVVCLIEASKKIERDMQKTGLDFRCITFVRNDVYQRLMTEITDYGKEMRATLDWEDPDLLKEMLGLRIRHGLEKTMSDVPENFDLLWEKISIRDLFGELSSDFIIRRSMMRPRNVIKFFSHIKGAAANFRKEKLEQIHYVKGFKAYSQDIFIEISREIGDIFPAAADVLYEFIECNQHLSHDEIILKFIDADIPEEQHNKLLDTLLYQGVLGMIDRDNEPRFIYDFQYDLKLLVKKIERTSIEQCYVINPALGAVLDVKSSISQAVRDLN